MTEHTLDELTRLAASALRHAELITIARTESPNKAQQIASVRWPMRQAKAARFLAMVARDFGAGAFEALVSSLEHARPAAAGSEHAQEYVMTAMNELYPENVPNVLTWLQGHGEGPDYLGLLHVVPNNDPKILKFDDEAARLGLDIEGKKTLLRRVIGGMFTHWAKPDVRQLRYGHAWSSARVAAKLYLPDDPELAKKLVLATIAYEGGATKYQNGLVYAFFEGDEANKATLQSVIDKLLSCGYTEDEVLAAWGTMLEVRYNHNFHTASIYGFVDGLMVGKQKLNKAFAPVAAKCVAQDLKQLLVDGIYDSGWRPTLLDEWWLVMMDNIIRATVRGQRGVTSAEFEEMMVHCIARGALSTAMYAFQRFGPPLGMWENHQGEKEFHQRMEKYMRGAKDKAVQDLKEFGVACALAEHLGEIDEAERLRGLARRMKQKCVMLPTFYYRNDMVR